MQRQFKLGLVLITLAVAVACGADRSHRTDPEDDERGPGYQAPADDAESPANEDALPSDPSSPDGTTEDPEPPHDESSDGDDTNDEPPPGQSECEAAGLGTEGACVAEADGTINAVTCDANGSVHSEYCGDVGAPSTDGCAIKSGRAQCISTNEVNFRREEPWFNCYERSSGAYVYTLAFSDGAVVHFAPDETMTEGVFEFFEDSAGLVVEIPGLIEEAGFVFGELDRHDIVLDLYGDEKDCYVAYYEDTPGIDTELHCDSYNPYLDTNYAHTLDFDPWGVFTVTEIGEFGPESYYGAYFIDGDRVAASYYANGDHTQFDLEFTLVGGSLVPVNLEEAYDFFCD